MSASTFRTDKRLIGSSHPVFIIAEIGSNHCQSLSLAKDSITAVAQAGADAVKFQSLNVQKQYLNPIREIKQLHERIDFDERWYGDLADHASKCGVEFICSPTYIEAIDFLEAVSVNFYKIASAQASSFPQIVEKVASLGKPVFVSTGLVTTDQLLAVKALFDKQSNDQLVIMHCNSIYPAIDAVVSMGRIESFRQMFGSLVGFSDHTLDHIASIMAVAKGAVAIEKHFTLSRKLSSPDAEFALDFDAFSDFVKMVRRSEILNRTDGRDSLEPEEEKLKEEVRVFCVAKEDIRKGTTLGSNNINFLRLNDDIVSKCSVVDAWCLSSTDVKAARDIKKESIVESDDISVVG